MIILSLYFQRRVEGEGEEIAPRTPFNVALSVSFMPACFRKKEHQKVLISPPKKRKFTRPSFSSIFPEKVVSKRSGLKQERHKFERVPHKSSSVHTPITKVIHRI